MRSRFFITTIVDNLVGNIYHKRDQWSVRIYFGITTLLHDSITAIRVAGFFFNLDYAYTYMDG
ncbi:hypothetical protein [Crinalium epipsammum]|uniref:hypothetical protein n=1 Tax=Crinalium epipsammum TaxID=241425 RepID=UPI0002E01324|nr:hypothetical protein [Crinalium epipsammum]